MPFQPKGLKAEEHPLKHKFRYSFGLTASVANANCAYITLVKNYKGVTSPTTTKVNPMNSGIDLETGAICAPMSIIQNLTLHLQFSALSAILDDEMIDVKFSWMPVFGSFPEKYDADDTGGSGGTVAAMLQLTKDVTQEDITPITTNKLKVPGTSDTLFPVSTVNLGEVYNTHLNMTTDLAMEDCPFDQTAFYNLMQYGTNKGALRSCVGKIRHGKVSYKSSGPGISSKSYFIKKFVPRPVRRIVPYSFFGILIWLPLVPEHGQTYTEDVSLQSTENHVGIKAHINYDEWNIEHDNGVSG